MAAATSWAGADADYAYAEHVLASLAPPPPPSGAAEMDAAPAEPGSISPPVKPRNAKAEETEDALSPTEKRRLDQRRKRNREAMQRARQRSKDYMDGLREQARALEQTHNGLLASLNEQVARFAGVATASERVLALRAQLDDARAQAQALMAQNLRFQEQIDERIKREDRMEGLLRELIREQERQAETFRNIFRETMDDSQLRVFFTEERAMRLILESRADRRAVDRLGFASCKPADLFGWTTLHRFVGQELFFSFKKLFRSRSAHDMMARNWANELRFATYRSASEAATQRFHMVQKINDDTFLIAREKQDPEHEGEVVRMLLLRFRLFEADGSYSVVTQSVRHDGDNVHASARKKIWANDACMWCHFTPVADPEGGSEHCLVHMAGKTDVGDLSSVRINVLETIMGLLRWENINVGPPLWIATAKADELE